MNDWVSYVLACFYSFYFNFSNYFVSISHLFSERRTMKTIVLALAQGTNWGSGEGQRQRADAGVRYVLTRSYSFHVHVSN